MAESADLIGARAVAPERTFLVDLRIPAHTYRSMYAGQARYVFALDRSGRKLRFPADALRPYVTHDGVSGTFAIDVDASQRLIGVRRLSGPFVLH